VDAEIATTETVVISYGGTDHDFVVTGATNEELLASIRAGVATANLDLTVTEGSADGKFDFTTDNLVATPIDIKVGSDAASASDTGTDTAGGGTMLNSINIETSVGASAALTVITAAIEQVAGDRAKYGALQNRLEYTVSNLMNVAEWTNAARSRIEDADFAAESARLAKAQILQQTGTAMLAQANASSQLALQLIK